MNGTVSDLYVAAKRVLDGLNLRIDSAPGDAVPVFDGIAELHSAIAAYEGYEALGTEAKPDEEDES